MNTPIARPTPLILIADDDRALRKLLALALTQAGYESVQVGNGEQVLQDFRRLQPDLVLLDAVMPEPDGFDCCQQLRTEFQSEIPILMVTVLDDQESIDRAFSVGATDYITKPIHWAVLRQRVKRLLQSHQAIQQTQGIQQQLNESQAWETLQRETIEGLHRCLPIDQLLTSRIQLWQRCFQIQQVGLYFAEQVTQWELAGEAITILPAPDDETIAQIQSLPAKTDALWQFPAVEGQSEEMTAEMGVLAKQLHLSALLMVPLVWEETVLGWLLFGRDHPEPWAVGTIARGRDLSRLLAIALGLTQK
ncbi:MAG: response regulator [Cyanobacteria bacterium P01_D01_bin.115]